MLNRLETLSATKKINHVGCVITYTRTEFQKPITKAELKATPTKTASVATAQPMALRCILPAEHVIEL